MALFITENQNIRARIVVAKFVADPQDRRIPDATKALIDKLLLERISLAGIARAVSHTVVVT
jgi:hypothetical protein